MAKQKKKSRKQSSSFSVPSSSSPQQQQQQEKKNAVTIPASSNNSDDDWISQLAKQATDGEPRVAPKQERIQKRNAKKQRRQQKEAAAALSSRTSERDNQRINDRDNTTVRKRPRTDNTTTTSTEHSLRVLNMTIASIVDNNIDNNNNRLFVVKDKKGKATKSAHLYRKDPQPRPRDYGGLGLARPSLFLRLDDPAFVPKLTEEFQEHIPGFFGKQRTKAMKKQLDGNMLWRQLLEKKRKEQKAMERRHNDDDESGQGERGGMAGEGKKKKRRKNKQNVSVDGVQQLSNDRQVQVWKAAGLL